ncbi:D-2-hydroxyacid dehydrogenase [Halovulum sp. GXIMD14794]
MHVLVVQPMLDAVTPDAEGRRAWRKRLEAEAPGYTFAYLDKAADLKDRIHEADIVAGAVPPEALARATSRLKWVQSWAAGPDTQLYPAFVASDIRLTCCKGNGAVPLAEHAMMLMMMLQRDAVQWLDDQRAHRWGRRTHGELLGKTCAILGTGHSGQDLALKAKAFHMRTLGLRRSADPLPNFDRMYAPEDLHAFLAEADFLVVTAPRTPTTVGLLGKAEFAAMKPGAYYVCFSRGGIADDAALLEALQSGHLAGAGLDAHDVEPLPEDSPFWDAPNTIVTPHNGASTTGTHTRGLEILIENLRRHRAGEELYNLIDKQAGY